MDPSYYGEQSARAECLYYRSVHNYHRGTDYMYSNSGLCGTREAVIIVEVSIVRVIKVYFTVTGILAGMSQEPNIFCHCHVIH